MGPTVPLPQSILKFNFSLCLAWFQPVACMIWFQPVICMVSVCVLYDFSLCLIWFQPVSCMISARILLLLYDFSICIILYNFSTYSDRSMWVLALVCVYRLWGLTMWTACSTPFHHAWNTYINVWGINIDSVTIQGYAQLL